MSSPSLGCPQPDGLFVHHILDKVRHRLGTLSAEDLPQMDRIIMVSGNYIDGHAQGAEQVAEAFIFCPAAAIYTVSSDEYDIRGAGRRARWTPVGRKDVTRDWEW
jgi:hypothetical protein